MLSSIHGNIEIFQETGNIKRLVAYKLQFLAPCTASRAAPRRGLWALECGPQGYDAQMKNTCATRGASISYECLPRSVLSIWQLFR